MPDSNVIYIGENGSNFIFRDDDIEKINCTKSIALVGEELAADTLEFTVFHNDSNSALRNLAFATPVWYEVDGKYVGKFFFKNIQRTATTKYKISCISVVGILDKETHYGGMYKNVGVRKLIDTIILADGLYSMDYRRIRLMARGSGAGAHTPSTSPTYRSEIRCKFVTLTSTASGIVSVCGHNRYNIDARYTSSGLEIRLNYAGTFRTLVTADRNIENTVICTIKPTAGTAQVNVNGVTTNVNISWVQSKTEYINNTAYPEMARIYLNGTVYRDFLSIYNGSTLVFNGYFCLNAYDYKIWMRDGVGGQMYDLDTKVNDWRYIGNSTGQDFIPVTQAKADIANSFKYLNGADGLKVSGWLKPASKRVQIYQILYSQNLNIKSNENGDVSIGAVSGVLIDDISSDEIYNNGTEEALGKTRNIILTEHQYRLVLNEVTIFDNTDGETLSDDIILYTTSPVEDWTHIHGDGITITRRNCNAAVASGIGVLYSDPYEHTEVKRIYNVSSNDDGRDVTVSDATLVTYLNATNVMDRLKAYYNNNVKKIKADILFNGEQCGNKYGFQNIFGERVEAILGRYVASVSSIVKMSCDFYSGYNPPSSSGGYNNRVFLSSTKAQTWTKPSGVTKIYVVLIGGGDQGSSGCAGEDGYYVANEKITSQKHIAQGGAAGQNGLCGKIYQVEITNPAASYSYKCGAGGKSTPPSTYWYGGNTSTSQHIAGEAGGATTFGSYSSASGERVDEGFFDLMTGKRYAYKVPDYSAQMRGGNGGCIYVENGVVKWHDSEGRENPFIGGTHEGGSNPQETVVSGASVYSGGNGGSSIWMKGISGATWGGGGGGYGNDDNSISTEANATINKTKVTYGCGGYGGIGGGAGGSEAGRRANGSSDVYWKRDYSGMCKGGKGGYGFSGGNGCIIIYY